MTALLLQAAASPPAPDSVRAALREVFSAHEYDWVERTNVLSWLREQYLRLLDWFAGLEQTSPAGYYLLLIAMIIVLMAIFAHFAYVVWHAFRPVSPQTGGARAAAPTARDAAWHLAEARRLSDAGRYAEALGHRFLGLVLELEGRKALTFHVSKTPAEYVDEVRLDGEGRGRFRLLVLALYRHLFGGVPCTEAAWSGFDREAGELAGGGHVAAG